MKKILYMLMLAAFVTPIVGCKEKGPMEKAGERADDAAKDTRRTMEKAGDKIDQAAKDTKRAVTNAVNR
ncbi:MAG TPA: hypothetical protein VK850_04815 [Candidatus Binatia bacterium]|nr:hypothetical protein [Candidatus Binatia bacterium]